MAAPRPPEAATKQDIAELRILMVETVRALRTELTAALAAASAQTSANITDRPPASDFMNVAQAALHLNRTEKAIRSLVERGELPHFRVGRRIQFDRQRLDRWMERHARPGATLR